MIDDYDLELIEQELSEYESDETLSYIYYYIIRGENYDRK